MTTLNPLLTYSRHLKECRGARGFPDTCTCGYLTTIKEDAAQRSLANEAIAALRTMVDAARRQPGNASLHGLADEYESLLATMPK